MSGLMLSQPYVYSRRQLAEPDWTRFPGWRNVTANEWASAQWQRANCVKSVKELRAVFGDLLHEEFYRDLVTDQQQMATMSMLLPPQMVNTMVPDRIPDAEGLYQDPIRRYMMPVASDRLTEWPSHPYASRDSLHEHDMWVSEGLTRRYPTKALAELVSTCPQYCGHCTRLDLVGNSTPIIEKIKLSLKPVDRYDNMIDYLRANPGVRDVVVSGGDVANVPWKQLESFLDRLLALPSIRDIRLATKALAALPQHWLQPEVVDGLGRIATRARAEGVNLAIHTHVNHVNSVTPLVAAAARAALDAGVRDVRNQGVLLRGVNATVNDVLDLCFALHGEAGILPYYLYMCDIIPNAEHWRIALSDAQEIQHNLMGYLPGYATPRVICDVPLLGKCWVHMVGEYDTERGISYWTKNYRTSVETEDASALSRTYVYYDPIDTLSAIGQQWWRSQESRDRLSQ